MSVEIIQGDALEVLRGMDAESVHCCVTSPPYWALRDYGVPGQHGLEDSPDEYVEKMVAIFSEVRRVLRGDGTLWLNLGDSYAAHPGQRKPSDAAGSPKQVSNAGSVRCGSRSSAGLKPKDLVGIPWMVAFALRANGWYLRQDIIWHKPNPKPESATDRCTRAHEYIFLLTKAPRYFYNADAIREPCTPQQRHVGIARARKYGYNGQTTYETWYHQFWQRRSSRLHCHDLLQQGHPPKLSETSIPDLLRPAGGNKRSVWTVVPTAFKGAHFATFPPELIEPCVLAGSLGGDVVLDPFMGAGTTGLVAQMFAREFIGIELNPAFLELARTRIHSALATRAHETSEPESPSEAEDARTCDESR
jgi:DNA modification methylase